MNVTRIALVLIATSVVLAEFARPTHWTPKRLSGETAVAGVGTDATSLDGLPPISMLALGSIDSVAYEVDGKSVPLTAAVALPKGARIIIVGWCADPEAKLAASGAFVAVDDRNRIDASRFLGLYRPDVQTYYSNPAFSHAGFRISLPASLLPAGTSELQIGVIAHDRRGFFALGGPIGVTVN